MNQAPLDGILLVNKPQDWTSHDVCAFVRKRFKVKKVGHAGTLDPMATGLLVLLLGKGTKKSNDLSASDKEYYGRMQLGIKTDSHDRTGKTIGEADASHITIEQVRDKVTDFTGEITQVPPMVSALKHEGVRLYQLARKGIEVPREGRPVQVYHFEIVKKEGLLVEFSARVSKGTYVRTLVHDLGESLGCFATLAELCRKSSGQFKVEDAVDIETLRGWTFQDLRRQTLPLALLENYAHSQQS